MIFFNALSGSGCKSALKGAMAVGFSLVSSFQVYAAAPYAVAEATGGSGSWINVPKSIPYENCSVAADAQLNAWFKTRVPNGARVLFPKNACYGYNKTLLLEDRKNLTIDGNGSTFAAVTLNEPNRSGWQIVAGSNIVLKNMTVIGFDEDAGNGSTYKIDHDQNPDTPNKEYAWQHAYSIKGTKGALLDNVKGFNTYGDFVGIAHDVRGPFCDKNCTREAEDVIVRNSEFANATRQGIAPTWVDGVSLINNTLTNVNRAGIDMESHEGWEPIRNINIIGNTFTDIGLSPIVMNGRAGTGTVGNFFIAENVVTPLVLEISSCQPPVNIEPHVDGDIVKNVTIQNNQFNSFGSAVSLRDVNNVTIAGNVFRANDKCSYKDVLYAITAQRVNGLKITNNQGSGFEAVLQRKGDGVTGVVISKNKSY